MVNGVHSAGLTSTALPAASAARTPSRDRHREVPRGDHADDAERLVEGDIQPPATGICCRQSFRARRVELQHIADVAGLPLRVADRVPELRTSSAASSSR